jgi:hypothetical protein
MMPGALSIVSLKAGGLKSYKTAGKIVTNMLHAGRWKGVDGTVI